MSKEIEREKHVHGRAWEKQASGYFSDECMAKDYVAAILRATRIIKPSAIVDLGGGTGFILAQLVKAGIPDDVRLVDVDDSDAQLSVCAHSRIMPLKGTFQTFRRSQIVTEKESLMAISRSVLQYAGEAGQGAWLSHLREQMLSREWFVHQSGCTEDAEASSMLNRLFKMIGVDKWVPHREAFVHLLSCAGFEVQEDFIVPAVKMVSEELCVRYGLSANDIAHIGQKISLAYPHRPDLYKVTECGFVFQFPYRVFRCSAV